MLPYFEPWEAVLGPDLTLRASGVGAVVGVLCGQAVAVRRARRRGLEVEVLFRALAWLLVGAVLGGHAGYLLFYEPQLLVERPRNLLRVWEGQATMGGFMACAALAYVFYALESRRRRRRGEAAVNAWAYLDCQLYGATLAWSIARIGCFAVHDHPGAETRFPLAVEGICPGSAPGAACHELGLYEAIFALAVFVWLARDSRPHEPGFVVGFVLFGAGVMRFGIEFLRHPSLDPRWLGLTPGHYGALALLALGAWILWGRGRVAESHSPLAPSIDPS